MEIKNKPLRQFYNAILSKNYEELWELLMAGNEIVVFLHNSQNEFHPDVVAKAYIFFSEKEPHELMIMTQGISYFNAWASQTVPKSWKEHFLDYCKEKDLVYLGYIPF